MRVRFAPSPTGPFHIGSARTVLFNWLFARQHGGAFVLRIEDTDVARSQKEFEENIFESIRWLDLSWDEGPDVGGSYGPYRQSERLYVYEKYLTQLLQEKRAYYCFCTKEQLEADRQAMLAQGLVPKYSGRCRALSASESDARIKGGAQAVIRFRATEGALVVHDLIRGKIEFDASLIGDVIIAKNLREPLYNFTVVIDDALMQITHVIRGEEHLSNTPRQIILQRTLGFEEPKYAHLPLILTSDRRKLSKRHAESALNEYRAQGYLPEALINFLALLGWHPDDKTEILTREELIEKFDLKRAQKAGAVFNEEKLNWLNAHYLRHMPLDTLQRRLANFIPASWMRDSDLLLRAIETERERMEKLSDFRKRARFFFELPSYDWTLLMWPREAHDDATREKNRANLILLEQTITNIKEEDFTREHLEAALMPLTEVWGRGALLWPLRAALSGSEASPGPFDLLYALRKNETMQRLRLAIQKLQ